MKYFEQIKENKHYAETLVLGDRIKVNIRHKTDGNKNIVDADVIFLRSDPKTREISVYFAGDGEIIEYGDYVLQIPFNDVNNPELLK